MRGAAGSEFVEKTPSSAFGHLLPEGRRGEVAAAFCPMKSGCCGRRGIHGATKRNRFVRGLNQALSRSRQGIPKIREIGAYAGHDLVKEAARGCPALWAGQDFILDEEA
ncbi:hypothetical protein ASE37_01530 [Rhizobium sp. Root268]|nr:hypothetical protein ASC86_01530 [Rhizobium sp. Root1212]KRD37707.1 hypothetical protein ASE37_01530 [Rhizobium sp. Root268]